MSTLKIYPTRFEAYMDDDIPAFTVEAFDSGAASVKVSCCVNAAQWDEIAPKIRECLIAMELEGDK